MRPGHDVVDRVGAVTAVLAAVVVSSEDRSPGERRPAHVRHLDHVAQTQVIGLPLVILAGWATGVLVLDELILWEAAILAAILAPYL
mgnify:CR=1 FL=1